MEKLPICNLLDTFSCGEIGWILESPNAPLNSGEMQLVNILCYTCHVTFLWTNRLFLLFYLHIRGSYTYAACIQGYIYICSVHNMLPCLQYCIATTVIDCTYVSRDQI